MKKRSDAECMAVCRSIADQKSAALAEMIRSTSLGEFDELCRLLFVTPWNEVPEELQHVLREFAKVGFQTCMEQAEPITEEGR